MCGHIAGFDTNWWNWCSEENFGLESARRAGAREHVNKRKGRLLWRQSHREADAALPSKVKDESGLS